MHVRRLQSPRGFGVEQSFPITSLTLKSSHPNHPNSILIKGRKRENAIVCLSGKLILLTENPLPNREAMEKLKFNLIFESDKSEGRNFWKRQGAMSCSMSWLSTCFVAHASSQLPICRSLMKRKKLIRGKSFLVLKSFSFFIGGSDDSDFCLFSFAPTQLRLVSKTLSVHAFSWSLFSSHFTAL